MLGPEREFPQGYTVPCWNPTTLGDELDQAGLPWAFYAVAVAAGHGVWSAYQAIKHIYYSHEWRKNIFSPPARFLNDVSNGNLRDGHLGHANIAKTPTMADPARIPGRPGSPQSSMRSVNRSTGALPQSLSFGTTMGVGTTQSLRLTKITTDLGARLPLLIVSPYAKRGYVSHVHYEHGSILKIHRRPVWTGPLSRKRLTRKVAGARLFRLRFSAA